MRLLQPETLTSPQESTRITGRGSQAWLLLGSSAALLLAILGGRLAYLQLAQGDQNRQLAEDNRIRLVPQPPERGRILDRKGRLLAGSRLSYSVFLWPLAQSESAWSRTIRRLAQILDVPEKEIQTRLAQAGYSSPSLVRVARGVSPQIITALAEQSSELPGVRTDPEAVRYYPNGDMAAHVLGYTSELSDKELKRRESEAYRLSDVVGQTGAEAAFESSLRGKWGGQQVEVDGAGQVLRILGEIPPQAGGNVHLTLDVNVQKAAEAALGNRKGAVIAMDPNNGAVLAMVSRPAFDPNLFSTRITDAQWQQLQNQDFPFVNRALQGYAPASTFKIVTTAAGIESGKFSPSTVLNTFAYLEIGGIQFWDHNQAGFGALGFTGALAQSSDTFFYQVGRSIGEKTLIDWTKRFGFGSLTGIELKEENRGLVPDETWKQQQIGEPWYLGDTINMSIGQGFLQATPLQVAVMGAVVANGGYRVKPHLLLEREPQRNWRTSLNLSAATLKVLQQGLHEVVTDGTARVMNAPNLPANAGKTGTAEDPPRRSHTWYVGYAPLDQPQILVVAFVENSGGGGGSTAAPIARQVMQAFFHPSQGKASSEEAAPGKVHPETSARD
ncbi:penicillin-binding protein 2 [Leptolyngbya sp. FACHB-261]|uniref:penicillin-binding protein 2 n=1 Tax=Leptolyngbya sp. FACHB-261 TaxID=2692806 RepID=UPI0016852BE7|nr:penicillin-binding protein 2 [Leptolyngbya sp. FACHB-261]MBD2104076.1 penicillin-binding protein 2 [Leptolyngbya sp. FACHB-261]